MEEVREKTQDNQEEELVPVKVYDFIAKKDVTPYELAQVIEMLAVTIKGFLFERIPDSLKNNFQERMVEIPKSLYEKEEAMKKQILESEKNKDDIPQADTKTGEVLK